MEEYEFISLHCRDCENTRCSVAAAYIPYDSNEGCTKRVPEDLAAKYYHYSSEVWPFIIHDRKYSEEYIDEKYQEYMDILVQIYSHSIGRRLDSKGKAILT